MEIYVNASPCQSEKKEILKVCTKKARSGEIKNMTGISSPYEAPENPTLEIDTNKETIDESMKKIKKCIMLKLKHGKLYN